MISSNYSQDATWLIQLVCSAEMPQEIFTHLPLALERARLHEWNSSHLASHSP